MLVVPLFAEDGREGPRLEAERRTPKRPQSEVTGRNRRSVLPERAASSRGTSRKDALALSRAPESTTPTERELRRLARFRSREGVLSVYLSFDPPGGERRDVGAAFVDATRPLERLPLSAGQRARLEEEQALVQEFVRSRFALHGRGVIVFSCRPRGLWQVFQLQVPVRPLARFAERAAVAQMAGILDEHERYAVALVDKDQARVLSVYLGQAERRAHITDEYPGRNKMGGWAAARYSHHRDAHLHAHVVRVAEALVDELRRQPFDRLMVGGPDEAMSAFLHVLPRNLRERVAGSFLAELFLSDEEVVERVGAVEAAAVSAAGARLVSDLGNAIGAGGLVALGWGETLQALLEGRVHKLVLAEGLSRQGSVCPEGHAAVLQPLPACPFCEGPLTPVDDLAEWAAERAFDTDARIEIVRGEGAQGLLARGDGIGAVLRY